MNDKTKDINQLQLQLWVSQRDHLATSQHLMQFQIDNLTQQIEKLNNEIKAEKSKLEDEKNRNKV